MKDVIDQVIHSHGMMVSLSDAELYEARERVTKFLEGRNGAPRTLVVDGIRFLRGDKPSRTRRPRVSGADDQTENA
jgi:hypothetical protein